jgi:ABC-type oligopeptide transport system substrate-binding subunit
MKKLIALTMVCGFAFAFAACGGAATTETTEAVDTVAAPMDTVAVDSLDSAVADSTGAM